MNFLLYYIFKLLFFTFLSYTDLNKKTVIIKISWCRMYIDQEQLISALFLLHSDHVMLQLTFFPRFS